MCSNAIFSGVKMVTFSEVENSPEKIANLLKKEAVSGAKTGDFGCKNRPKTGPKQAQNRPFLPAINRGF